MSESFYKSPWDFRNLSPADRSRMEAASVEARDKIAKSPHFTEMIRKRVEEIRARHEATE